MQTFYSLLTLAHTDISANRGIRQNVLLYNDEPQTVIGVGPNCDNTAICWLKLMHIQYLLLTQMYSDVVRWRLMGSIS